MTETLEVLKWAHDAARDDEIVAMFWEELCKAVHEPLSASAEKVLSELCEYGGNTIANLFRGHGVDYAEVAYDVACALKPWLDDKPFSEGDIEACERYVLKRMEVQEDDLTKLIDAVRATVGKQVARQQVLRALSVVLLAWTVIDIAGPAMRVTIPGVTYVALLRKLYQSVHA